jgi:hypothetical protein
MRGMVDGGIELWLLALGEAVAAMDMFAIIACHFCHIIDVEIFVILSTWATARPAVNVAALITVLFRASQILPALALALQSGQGTRGR